ncbi:ArsR/SmtB family transcription factor [Pararhizobium mangrovi]|uniref:Helix-turn-helix transcriptional regulator n=1 Tax=Pararhizobium mangrovi TaxID=2590452 RepID=A0A506UC61_9HYPH|nr:metalloregulator ArsR/SmtB family transcription factor [Pararhizobium mangrovi]TPW32022.1 helix-turn-helix transcriptional regulator [Pararhizobium mangrovi]
MNTQNLERNAHEWCRMEATSRQLAALAHPARLSILNQLAAADACCVKDVVGRVGLAQSTVSQHIRILVDAGLVTYRANRQASAYALDRAALHALSGEIDALFETCCGTGCERCDR